MSRNKSENVGTKYELQPPDGGWGYIVATALTIAFNVTVVPMAAFGLIYGQFLANIGDETTGTTLANGIFNTVFNFTGLAANNLLQRYSFRFVGLAGACFFFVGSCSLIFVGNLWQMIVSFGVIQGVGMGLMFPAFFTALNSYFNKKLNLMNSIAQTFMVLATMAFPAVAQFFMDKYGFRGTLALIAALSLHTVLAALVLQPVRWHMTKIPILDDSSTKEELQLKSLLNLKLEEGEGNTYVMPRPRNSIISIGDRALSVTTINRLGTIRNQRGVWNSLVKSLDLGMFKDLTYVNISIGLSLSFTADVAFISIIPLILLNAGFDSSQTTLLMTTYFGADVVGRVLLSVMSALWKLKNRYLLLGGVFLSAAFRTAFVMGHTFHWKLATLGVLGFLRAFIQTPLPLVISDQYSENFATAFSLYMVVCGVVSLIFGPLMSVVKSVTKSDVMVVHLLTLAFLICSVTWILELVMCKRKKVPKK